MVSISNRISEGWMHETKPLAKVTVLLHLGTFSASEDRNPMWGTLGLRVNVEDIAGDMKVLTFRYTCA